MPDRGQGLIDLTVTVIVLVVTALCCAGPCVWVGVITVGSGGHIAAGHLAGVHALLRISIAVAVLIRVPAGAHVLIDLIVAVVVDLIAQLDRPGMNIRGVVIAVFSGRPSVSVAIGGMSSGIGLELLDLELGRRTGQSQC